MKLHFVNHASYALESKEVFLLVDPWLEGTAFDNGWSLLAETKFTYTDFSKVTHIWFSHEHPDHFSPFVLNKIPLEFRQKIEVLFQITKDKKVKEFCEKIGFKKVVELLPYQKKSLSTDFYVQCEHFSDGDSWLYVNVNGKGVLNLNDCMVKTIDDANQIQLKIAKVDILLTQFSYAHKVGEENDHDKRLEKINEKVQRIKNQIDVFKPNFLLPFASYVYFSHIENKYMNPLQFPLRYVCDRISGFSDLSVIVLKPGDVWSGLDYQTNDENIHYYEQRFEYVQHNSVFIPTKKIEIPHLIDLSKNYIVRVNTKNIGVSNLFKKLTLSFYLADYDETYLLDFTQGLVTTSIRKSQATIKITSEALAYFFQHEWGGATCHVNARYNELNDAYPFNLLIQIGIMNNLGEIYSYKKPTFFQKIKFKLTKVIGT